MRLDNLKKILDENINSSDTMKIQDKDFSFNIDFLDNHIDNIQSVCDASYAQVSLASLTTIGFLLAHAGIKNTSMYFTDLSSSGTGKTFNMTLQFKLLLQEIEKLQEELQLSSEDKEEIKRYHNVHRGKITTAALNQCIKTQRAQFLTIDELGLLMSRGSDIIDEVTKLYGVDQTSLSVTKGEVPNSKNIVPVAFSFMGATTLSYFGGSKSVMKELLGGFINRQLLAYNNTLRKPEEITSIFNDTLDYKTSNEQAMKLFHFAKTCTIKFQYSKESEQLQLEFKKEVQKLVVKYHEMGTEFGSFYSRIEQNLQIILNILHTLKCFELNTWFEKIDKELTSKTISLFKIIVFTEIDKLIDYLSDGELLKLQSNQLKKIKYYVEKFFDEKGYMPEIRDIQQKTKIKSLDIEALTKNYLEIIPGTRKLRYCEKY